MTNGRTADLFRKAFHNSPAVHSIVRFPDAVLVEINETFTKVFGYTRHDVLGKNPLEFNFWVVPQHLQMYRQQLETKGFVRGFEVQVRAKDGSIRTVLLSSDLVDIDGVKHSLSAGVDITERKRAEQALRESEQKFRALFEGSSQGVMIHDEEKFLEVNSATLRILGFNDAKEVLGKHPKDTAPPFQPGGESSDSASRRYIARCMKEGSARFEWMSLNAHGELTPLEVILTRVELNGRPVMQAVINDISERKKAETELQNALARERELNQLKSEFVSLVSHEFRTPLEVIMSSADNLQRYFERLAPEKRDQLLRTINKSVRRMAGMMEDVLLMGRFESGRIPFKPLPFDLAAFCNRVKDEMETATNRSCPIHLEIKKIPAKAIGDETVLRHILSNLLSNAIKYSAPGKSVHLTVSKRAEDAVFQIVDGGCGIPEADRKRLFQAFHRGSNVRQISGTGLGLLIVQRCIDLHGGDIEFQSVEGQGTTFTVRVRLFAKTGINA